MTTEERVSRLEGRLDGTLEQLNARIGSIESRLGSLENKMDGLNRAIIIIGGGIFAAILGLGIWDRVTG